MNNEDIFIDTNILVYSKLEDSAFHYLAKSKLSNFLMFNKIFLSHQILREYWNTLSRISFPMIEIDIKLIFDDIEFFKRNFNILTENEQTSKYLFDIAKIYKVRGKQIHDANIVSTMLANNIKNIFTHNVKDFVRYNSLINIIPLE